jgi:excisionase family DNA binding protein
MTQPERLITVEELERLLGLPTSWIYRQAAERRIPSYKVGHYRKFRLSEVEAYVQRCRVEPTIG